MSKAGAIAILHCHPPHFAGEIDTIFGDQALALYAHNELLSSAANHRTLGPLTPTLDNVANAGKG